MGKTAQWNRKGFSKKNLFLKRSWRLLFEKILAQVYWQKSERYKHFIIGEIKTSIYVINHPFICTIVFWKVYRNKKLIRWMGKNKNILKIGT